MNIRDYQLLIFLPPFLLFFSLLILFFSYSLFFPLFLIVPLRMSHQLLGWWTEMEQAHISESLSNPLGFPQPPLSHCATLVTPAIWGLCLHIHVQYMHIMCVIQHVWKTKLLHKLVFYLCHCVSTSLWACVLICASICYQVCDTVCMLLHIPAGYEMLFHVFVATFMHTHHVSMVLCVGMHTVCVCLSGISQCVGISQGVSSPRCHSIMINGPRTAETTTIPHSNIFP